MLSSVKQVEGKCKILREFSDMNLNTTNCGRQSSNERAKEREVVLRLNN